jgi:phage baseplate assembly protein V
MSGAAGAIRKLTEPLRRRIALMVGRCTVKLVNDALKMQGVQITLLADEAIDNVERMQEYGFTSHPHPGAEALSLAVGGTRNHVVVIKCEDRRYRLTGLEEGEVAIYDDLGSKVVLKRGNVIEVTAATKIRMVTPLLEVTGKIEADGDIRDNRPTNNRTMAGMREQYNIHTHPENDAGGPTGVPNQAM